MQKLGDKQAREKYVNEDDKYGSRRYGKDEKSYDDANRRRYEDSRQLQGQDRYDILKMLADTGAAVAVSVPEIVSTICLHFQENLMWSDLDFPHFKWLHPFKHN